MKFNLYHFTVCTSFLLVIYLPFTIAFFEDDKKTSEIEKRDLSVLPNFPESVDEVINFPKAFDNYYQDHFGLRESLTKQYRRLKYTIGDSPSQDVTIGKDGFLFLGTVKTGYNNFLDPMGDYRGINKYSSADLSLLVDYMSNLNKWLSEKNIKYVLVIAPNKETIYSEMLPNYVQKVNPETSHDQIVEALGKLENFLIIDLRKTLIDAKKNGHVYYKTDTHWNYNGADIAQKHILSELNKATGKDVQITHPSITQSDWGGGDLADFIGVRPLDDRQDYPHFSNSCNLSTEEQVEGDTKISHFSCESAKLNLLIFGDSFSNWFKPFFSRTFKNSTFVSGKLNFSRIKDQLDNVNKPDIIIEEWVERTLPYIPPEITEISPKNKSQVLFEANNNIVFQNNFGELQLINSSRLNLTENEIAIKSEKEDPILVFPEMKFSQGKQHIIRIRLSSSVDSILQVFFSEEGATDYPFSEENSIQIPIQHGDNDVYIHIPSLKLGKSLRLDPISGLGTFTISELTVKEIN